MDNLYVALIHFPVVNRKQEPIGSALTTIDLHDIARACATFGVKGFFVVTPFEDQANLAEQVISHWTKGVGGRLNPSRKRALELIRVTGTFEGALDQIRSQGQGEVITVATSAKDSGKSIGTNELKHNHDKTASHVLVFGTAWGLADELRESCDFQLAPISGPGEYNHLSVRSAASIYLDRLTNG